MKSKGGASAGHGLGPVKPRKWEQLEEGTKWCSVCHDYTEHDRLGCVECYDPHKDRIDELEDPNVSQFAQHSDEEEQ
jgi:hypothetical protein